MPGRLFRYHIVPVLTITLSMNHKKPASVPGIYLITNKTNGKVYVGQARNINARWSHHRHLLLKGRHNNPYLQRAWDKLGPDAFLFSVAVDLSSIPRGELRDEQNKQEALVFAAHADTYNLLHPGLEGHITQPETSAKLTASKKLMWDRLREDPVKMAAHVDASHAWRRAPEGKRLQSGWFTELWKDPTFRATLSRKSAEKWERPGYRENHAAQLGAAWADPAKRAERVAGLKAAWADPVIRATRIEAARAGKAAARARRKAAAADHA